MVSMECDQALALARARLARGPYTAAQAPGGELRPRGLSRP